VRKVKELAKKTYHATKNNLPRPVFWSVPALLVLVTLTLIVHLLTDNTIKPTTVKDAGKATVAVVRRDFKNGGTGVILESSETESKVLTNGHVCRVVENGGVVVTDNGSQHSVTGYKRSQDHDLCIITVAADLGVNTQIASDAPEPYSTATISGHPSLLPTVVTTGHFSGHLIVDVLTEITPCTEEDLKKNTLMCIFFGGIPKVTSYEAQLVTATIQPGSSGSAVYNSNGEIAGLVFAGSGELGYAVIVPYEFVANFVLSEEKTTPYIRPQTTIALGVSKKEESKDGRRPRSYEEISHDCLSKPEAKENPDISKICKLFSRDMIFGQER